MNFPVVFRIYAVLNLIAFLAFGILTAVLTVSGSAFGPLTLAAHYAITLWLLISAIAWFFANKNSYHFLFSLSFLLLMVAGIWIFNIVTENGVRTSSDRLALFALAGICVLYTLFLLMAAFYKPVVEWTSSRVNWKHHGILATVIIIFSAGFFTFGKMYRNSSTIDTNFLLSSNAEYTEVPTAIKGGQWVRLDLELPAMVNSLTIPLDANYKGENLRFAKMYYSDSSTFDYTLAPSQVIQFKLKGEAFIAEFNAVKARTIQLFPMEDADKNASAETSFNIASISPIWTYGYFDEHTAQVFYDEVSYGEYAGSEEGYEGEMEEGTEEGNGRDLTEYNLPELFSLALTNSNFLGNEWMFDAFSERLTLSYNSASGSAGMYTQGIGNLYYSFGTAVRQFRQYSGYEYESQFTSLSGKDFYVSKAKGYDFEGNGTEFNFVNPEMIVWMEKNLVVDPSTTVLGYTTQQYYDKMFSRFMRMMVLSRTYLETNGIDAELEAYETAANGEQFYGPSYLLNRYSSVQLDDYSDEQLWKGEQEFIGFWLRRKHDGSYEQCWVTLSKIMTAYDNAWFSENTVGNDM